MLNVSKRLLGLLPSECGGAGGAALPEEGPPTAQLGLPARFQRGQRFPPPQRPGLPAPARRPLPPRPRPPPALPPLPPHPVRRPLSSYLRRKLRCDAVTFSALCSQLIQRIAQRNYHLFVLELQVIALRDRSKVPFPPATASPPTRATPASLTERSRTASWQSCRVTLREGTIAPLRMRMYIRWS